MTRRLSEATVHLQHQLESLAAFTSRTPFAHLADQAGRFAFVATTAEAIAIEARALADEARDQERRV